MIFVQNGLFVKQWLVKICYMYIMYHVFVENDLNNATACNIIKTLIYRKYQWCILHAFIILHTPRYVNHLSLTTKLSCLNQ
ncbi:hypothetical protein Hanom_Chr12g01137561 [Helianthus anomalus]